MFNKSYLFFIFLLGNIAGNVNAQNYLSNLCATKDDPLFTTYAAPLTRSEFIVDEGYQFKFFHGDNGINFETDTGGHLSLAFKLNGDVRYRLNQMYVEPVITTSYNDLVKYHYGPFEDINVDVFFQVYSSRIAIQDITITNNSGIGVELDVYPFLQHPKKLHDVVISPNRNYFTFGHEEHPDGWTVAHNIPYEESLNNVYLLSEPADSYGAYNKLGTLDYAKLRKTSLENYCVEWGTVKHVDGSPCLHLPPDAQMIVLHNGSSREILTEDAPKWGDVDPNIPGNGYQGCELGNFQHPKIAVGDSFTVIFTCDVTEQQRIANGVITELPAPGGIRTDVQLSENDYPQTPQNVDIHFSQNFTSAVISWEQLHGYLYSVYRRTGSTPGRFDLIADSLNYTGYLDVGLNPDSTYSYVVIAQDSNGRYSGHSRETGQFSNKTFFSDIYNQRLSNFADSDFAQVVALQKSLSLGRGEAKTLRFIRGATEKTSSLDSLYTACENLLSYDMQQAVIDDEAVYSQIPRLEFDNPDYEMMYWSAFSMMRQCMMPPEGECSYNYYLFSREPIWGWGHGGQVFHESLAMLAYVYMDPLSAMNSQRVYMERQWDDGYIPYRTGPYLNEVIPYAGQYTTSAPWFNWGNWEIYQITGDKTFLREAYESGVKFYNYWLNYRDADGDGLCEWGAHAVLECVRDGQVAVWDQVGWPSNFECLDLNCMLVQEARSLAAMAAELGKTTEARNWSADADIRALKINHYFWDSESGFYFHIDKDDHDFNFNTANDLKRQEIIGFLPLWANVATVDKASILMEHLTNPQKFWRNNGIPTLSADDPYYNHQGYWNGPLWIQWNYLVFRGLINYGYYDNAHELAEKILGVITSQLKDNHWFWELYSPDHNWGGWHKPYIWTGIIARMMIDMDNLKVGIRINENQGKAKIFILEQNYPNPFNSRTIIRFSLPEKEEVTLKIFNLLGEEIRSIINESLHQGTYELFWDGKDRNGNDMSTGLYFYSLATRNFCQVKKMILTK